MQPKILLNFSFGLSSPEVGTSSCFSCFFLKLQDETFRALGLQVTSDKKILTEDVLRNVSHGLSSRVARGGVPPRRNPAVPSMTPTSSISSLREEEPRSSSSSASRYVRTGARDSCVCVHTRIYGDVGLF